MRQSKPRRVPGGTHKEEQHPSLCPGICYIELASRDGRVKGRPGAMLWEASSH